MNIDDWIQRIMQPRAELGGMSVCPFAKAAEYEIIETDGSISIRRLGTSN
jgi:hypothetical protein